MEAIKQFVTVLILDEEWDIDQVYDFTLNRFCISHTDDEIKQAFDQVLEDLPELN